MIRDDRARLDSRVCKVAEVNQDETEHEVLMDSQVQLGSRELPVRLANQDGREV